MPRVTYAPPEGPAVVIDAPAGETARNVALANNVDGIVGECGGQLMCASCHVYVDEAFLALLPAISEDEDAMLAETASERLSQQPPELPDPPHGGARRADPAAAAGAALRVAARPTRC